MAGFGGLGGLGGTTYPTRVGTPQSSVVEWAPDAISWRNDWQHRYNEEAGRAQPEIWKPGMVELLRGHYATTNTDEPSVPRIGRNAIVPKDIIPYGTSPWYAIKNNKGSLANGLNQYVDQQMQEIAAKYPGLMAQPDFAQLTRDNLLAKASKLYVPDSINGHQTHTDGSHQVMGMVKVQDAYNPDFTALNAERDRMLPQMENQARLQQAYNSMTGWGQLNGVMSPNYTDPNFGQINGDFGQDIMGDQAFQASRNGPVDWSQPAMPSLQTQQAPNMFESAMTPQKMGAIFSGQFSGDPSATTSNGPFSGGQNPSDPGLDTSWLSGVFNSLGGLAGVYGAPNSAAGTQKKSWL